MTEMTRRERLLTASRKKRADKLPFSFVWFHTQTGWAEREARDRGMALYWMRPPYIMKMHGVDVSEAQASGQAAIRRTYSTPVGSVYLDEIRGLGSGQWHGLRSWNSVVPWQTERLIKAPEDYKVVKYMVENTEYIPDYFPIEQAMDWLGDDGIVLDDLSLHSPMQMLMIDWIGSEGGRFFIHHAKYPDLVEDLYQALSKSREPLYEIAAKSPTEITWFGDNIDGVLVNPRLFEKYFMPEYEKMGKAIHKQGKLMGVHMDGRVNVLKDLIARTPVDIIEALHPPPMGDLPIGEALSLWKDKIIWMGFPGSVHALGPDAVRKHALALLREVIPGDRLVFQMSTENLVPNKHLMMLTSILENASLPLTEEKIDEIERSVSPS